MLRELDSPFLDAKSEPDKDGWTNLSKGVLQILASAAIAIVRGTNRHYHVADHEDPEFRRCAKCGLDLSDLLHIRVATAIVKEEN